MTPFFSSLAKLAIDLQRSTVITVVAAIIAGTASALLLKIRYTARATGIALGVIGVLILAWGGLLAYARYSDPSVKVPPTALRWVPAVGAALLLIALCLRLRRRRGNNERIKGLAEVNAEHIRIIQQELGLSFVVDQMTDDGELVIPRLMSLVRLKGKARRIILAGELGSGKTSTLLRFAIDGSLPTVRRSPAIPIYVDLAQYAAQPTETQSLSEFVLSQFDEPARGEMRNAWNDPTLDVSWIFLFDNANEAELQEGAGHYSWQRAVADFTHRRSPLAPFHAVIATSRPPVNLQSDNIVRLGRLTPAGRDKLLMRARVNPADVAVLAKDRSFDWYLTNPATLELLTPTLARHTWTTDDNVHKVMGAAIDRLLQHRPKSPATDLSSLQATVTAAIAFLCSRPVPDLDSPVEIREVIAHVASVRRCSPRSINRDLNVLVRCGLAKRLAGRDGTAYLEFGPAVAAYFYTCALLDDPSQIRASYLLSESRFRLTTVSLLKVADSEIVVRFVTEVEPILEHAIAGLDPTELAALAERDDLTGLADWAALIKRAYMALSALADGLQDRLELLDEELRARAIDFTIRAIPHVDADVQAGLLEASYVLGTPEQAMSALALGLHSRDATRVLDAASRIVNTMTEMAELDDTNRGQLVRVIILSGLRSLTLNRGHGDVPYALRLADGAGAAAIILYGTIFGLGGVLQIINNPHTYAAQVFEFAAVMLLAFPIFAARYSKIWRKFILSKDIEVVMLNVTNFLAILGAAGGAGLILYCLTVFTIPLMPLLVCYILAWPSAVLYYLLLDEYPTTVNVVFPLPQVFHALWKIYIVGRSRKRSL